jgi:hypothetical protein
MQAGLADVLRQQGHVVGEPLEIVFPPQRRTRDSVTNLGFIASLVSDAVVAAIGQGTMPLVLEGNCTQAVGPAGGVARTTALLAPRAVAAPGWYMHLDLDVAGPEELPGALTPAPHSPPALHWSRR